MRGKRQARQVSQLDTLRRLGVWLPVVGIGILVGLLPALYPQLRRPEAVAAYAATMGVVTVGAFLFSRWVFQIVAQKEREILRRNEELAALNAVGAVVNESLDLDLVLDRALEKVLDVTGADAGEILLWNESQDELVQRAFRGVFPQAFGEIVRFRRNEGFPGRVVREDQTIVVEDLSSEREFLRRQVVEAGFHAFAGVPLRSKGSVVGVMGIACLEPGGLAPEDIDLLGVLGNQIGIAIENARLYAQLREMTTLEERQRIAREMHDGLAQELGYLHLKISELEEDVFTEPPDANRKQLSHMKAVVDKAYEDVRQAIFGLRIMVSKGLGLIPTLTEYLHEVSEQTGINVELQTTSSSAIAISPHAEVQLIRIVQESLANVRKHSGAKRAWVIMEEQDRWAKITVRDDGRGFSPRPSGRSPAKSCFGLQAMQERADSVGGILEVSSIPGKGTEVVVRFPLQGDKTLDAPARSRATRR